MKNSSLSTDRGVGDLGGDVAGGLRGGEVKPEDRCKPDPGDQEPAEGDRGDSPGPALRAPQRRPHARAEPDEERGSEAAELGGGEAPRVVLGPPPHHVPGRVIGGGWAAFEDERDNDEDEEGGAGERREGTPEALCGRCVML